MPEKKETKSREKPATKPATGRKRKQPTKTPEWKKDIIDQRRFKFNDNLKQRWLEVYAETGTKQRAHDAVGIGRRTFARHLDEDEDFSKAVDEALIRFNETSKEIILRRGIYGRPKQIVHMGNQVWVPALNENNLPIENPHFDPEKAVDRQKNYPLIMIPLVEMVVDSAVAMAHLRKVDPTYNEKRTEDHNVSGGFVMRAPPEQTMDEFDKEEDERMKNAQPPEID